MSMIAGHHHLRVLASGRRAGTELLTPATRSSATLRPTIRTATVIELRRVMPQM